MSGGDIRCSAVIVAAGSAQRMQGIDKLLAPLDGVPVLRRTVEALASAPEITELIVVTRADRLEAVQALCEGLSKPVSVVPGGKTRAESVLCGLSAAAMPYAAIHDGARPLVTNEVIAQAIAAAVSCGAAAPAVQRDVVIRQNAGERHADMAELHGDVVQIGFPLSPGSSRDNVTKAWRCATPQTVKKPAQPKVSEGRKV